MREPGREASRKAFTGVTEQWKSDAQQAARALSRELSVFGAATIGRLDVAVNNAGTEGKPGPVTEQTAESYAATFDTNVLGVLLSMKHE
jgi:NAD(P)-dependent dehydrogenase (short-subunit alcohol dehydrogenase family)